MQTLYKSKVHPGNNSCSFSKYGSRNFLLPQREPPQFSPPSCASSSPCDQDASCRTAASRTALCPSPDQGRGRAKGHLAAGSPSQTGHQRLTMKPSMPWQRKDSLWAMISSRESVRPSFTHCWYREMPVL